jgi:AraC family transcriptional regulator, regulatory protein of adaptative response / methylated-DNA-[protein]-cysteine methyltransferase
VARTFPNAAPRRSTLASRHAAAVEKLCRFIETSDDEPKLEELARRAGWSVFHLHRVFRAVTGVTPKAYASHARARRARASLETAKSVTEAVYAAGYVASSRFYETSNERLGMTPSAYRAGGKGFEIRFAVGQCSLGSILVAATERGVCSISLGDDPEALCHELERRFPRARLVGGDGAFEALVARVVGLVEDPRSKVDLPLDIRGTAFQERVWQALTKIPIGKTTTYSELARSLGSPASVRAVARACAQNPLAVAIPCHRVVRKDGDLAGYRWGIERKRELIVREAGE